MTLKRDHIWMLAALIVGFVVGIYYSKNNGAGMILSAPGLSGGTNNPLGMMGASNGTATIPIYGMVTAAQGMNGQNE